MDLVVDICNEALVEAKYDETIATLDEDSVSARRCKRLYDPTRREVLTTFPWTFATRFEEAAKLDIDEPRFVFSYPKKALRILNIYASKEEYLARRFIRFPTDVVKVENINDTKVIVSPYEKCFIEYIYDEEQPENFSPLFKRLLYLSLSLKLAKLAGADNPFLSVLMNQITDAENRARAHSITEDENNIHEPYADLYTNVRGYGHYRK